MKHSTPPADGRNSRVSEPSRCVIPAQWRAEALAHLGGAGHPGPELLHVDIVAAVMPSAGRAGHKPGEGCVSSGFSVDRRLLLARPRDAHSSHARARPGAQRRHQHHDAEPLLQSGNGEGFAIARGGRKRSRRRPLQRLRFRTSRRRAVGHDHFMSAIDSYLLPADPEEGVVARHVWRRHRAVVAARPYESVAAPPSAISAGSLGALAHARIGVCGHGRRRGAPAWRPQPAVAYRPTAADRQRGETARHRARRRRQAMFSRHHGRCQPCWGVVGLGRGGHRHQRRNTEKPPRLAAPVCWPAPQGLVPSAPTRRS